MFGETLVERLPCEQELECGVVPGENLVWHWDPNNTPVRRQLLVHGIVFEGVSALRFACPRLAPTAGLLSLR